MYFVKCKHKDGVDYLGPRDFYGGEYSKHEGFPNKAKAERAILAAKKMEEASGLLRLNRWYNVVHRREIEKYD